MKEMDKQQKQLPWYELPPKRWRNNPECRSFRDSQKQKLYDAETITRRLMEKQNLNPSFSSIEEIQKFIDKLISSAWFKKRFGDNVVCKVINARENQRTAYARFHNISLPHWAWNKVVVLHELSHIVSRHYEGSHGRFFARAFLEIVRHVLGQEAAWILKKYYKKGKVKYLPKRELSEETREKLRQGFINRVLKQKVEA